MWLLELGPEPLVLEQGLDRIGRQGTFVQPLKSPFLLKRDQGWIKFRILLPKIFNKPAVTREALIGNDDLVKRSFFRAATSQPDFYCH